MRAAASHRAGRGGHVPWLAALGLALVVLGLALPELGGGPALDQDVGTTSAALPPYVVEPVVRFEQTPARPQAAAGNPRQLVVPRLHVAGPVVPVDLEGRTLVPPADPQTLGWWADSALPGALWGGTLITGHTVHSGGGALDDLETLRRGDSVELHTTRGVVRYSVTGVTVYRKASLARASDRVFSQRVPHRLVLVTCEDWNGVEYLSNAVVLADLVPKG